MSLLQEINPQVAKPFIRCLGIVGRRYSERDSAASRLDEHIEKVKKGNPKAIHKQVSELREKIFDLVEKEKKIAGYSDSDSAKIKILEGKISDLSSALESERKKKEEAQDALRKQAEEMRKTFDYLKSKLTEFISEKRVREERLSRLHDRIQKSVPKNS